MQREWLSWRLGYIGDQNQLKQQLPTFLPIVSLGIRISEDFFFSEP